MQHIPNILSCIRILLIPLFIRQMLRGDTIAAAAILAASGLTDLLDGFLARRFGWITQLGKVLDPVADKLTQVAVCVVLLTRMRQYWPFFIVLLAKETVMLAMGGYLLRKDVRLDSAKWFGKVVTVLFYVSMIAIVFIPSMPQWLVTALLSVVTVCAVVAAFLYIPEFVKYKRQSGEGKR